MHKYQPRVHIVRCGRVGGAEMTVIRRLEDVDQSQIKTFVFPETAFTAVTAYQNQLVSYSSVCLFNDYDL